jgi:hypothetical protein
VLDRAADADGEIQLGRDDLAGLADLHVVGAIARVDRRARGADAGAELVGQRIDDRERLGRTERAPAGHDAARALQVGAIALALLQADEAGVRRQRRR